MKIGRHISPCAEKVGRFVPEPGMLLIFVKQPSGRNRLPLALPIQPLADAYGKPSGLQPLLDQLLPVTPAGKQNVALLDQPAALDRKSVV